MHFVSRYRELLQTPAPIFGDVDVTVLIDEVIDLLRGDLDGVDVAVVVTPDSLSARADAALSRR